jgi:L-iditol 2-dehydrogenase
MSMRAACFYPPRTIRIQEIPRPEPSAREVLVRVEACGLCGSDLAKFLHASAEPGEVLGHEVAGVVEAIGDGAPADSPGARYRPGDRVVVAHHVPCFECHFCLHGNFSMCRGFKSSRLTPGGFSEFLVASSRHVAHSMLPIPRGLSFEEATFMEPLACALKALPALNLRASDLVVLFGLGPMGILFARLLSARHAARVIGVEPNEARRARASAEILGAFSPDDPALADRVHEETEGRGADAVILLAGRGSLVRDAVALSREAGRICVFAASSGESAVPLSIDLMYYREIVLFGSYSPDPAGFSEALAILADGTVRVGDLVTHRLPIEGTQEAFERAVRGDGLKFMIRPRGDQT